MSIRHWKVPYKVLYENDTWELFIIPWNRVNSSLWSFWCPWAPAPCTNVNTGSKLFPTLTANSPGIIRLFSASFHIFWQTWPPRLRDLEHRRKRRCLMLFEEYRPSTSKWQTSRIEHYIDTPSQLFESSHCYKTRILINF